MEEKQQRKDSKGTSSAWDVSGWTVALSISEDVTFHGSRQVSDQLRNQHNEKYDWIVVCHLIIFDRSFQQIHSPTFVLS